MTPEQLMSGVDMKVFKNLSRGRLPCDERSWKKFFDWKEYGRNAIARTRRFKLDLSKGKRVLDVGCGFGYFLRACQKLGHEVVGIDVPDENFCKLWEVMQVSAYSFALSVSVPLPSEIQDYDLITMWGFGLPRELCDGKIRSCETWKGYRSCVVDVLTRLSERKGSIFATVINIGRDYLLESHRWQSLADEFDLRLKQHVNLFSLERV